MSDPGTVSGSTGNSGREGEDSGEWTDDEMDAAEPLPMPEVDDDDAEPTEEDKGS